MKLLMVSHYFGSHHGGIEAVAANLFQRIAGPEWITTWAAADVSEPPRARAFASLLPLKTWNGVESRLGLPFPVPSVGALRTLRDAMRSADVVLLHDCLYLSNIAAFLLARRRRVPVVITQHIGTVPYRNPLLKLIMTVANALVTRRMLKNAQQVVFISEITRGYFATVRFRRPPLVIFNGVDTGQFRPGGDGESRSAMRERFRLPADKPMALFVGRFVEKKGLEILRRMAQRERSVTWAFAGSGPMDPAAWKLDNVRVFTDLYGGAIADLYRAGDLLALPSTGEGFPLVIQEALASGLPVVCGADTATADAELSKHVRGVALTPGDAERCAEDFLAAVHELLAEPNTLERVQERFRFAASRYSWEHTVQQYQELLARLSGSAGAVSTVSQSEPQPRR